MQDSCKILCFLQDTFRGKANPCGKVRDVGPTTLLLTEHIKKCQKVDHSTERGLSKWAHQDDFQSQDHEALTLKQLY